MPDFDLDAALTEPTKQDPVPTCPRCHERMHLDSCETEPAQAGFSLKRVCHFVCSSAACDVPENEDRGVWMTEVLVVACITCDGQPLGAGALRRVGTGRCPWCLSISGPSHNHHQRTDTGVYLTCDCEDCEHHWEEHLEVPGA